eukprot:8974742-Heterocapsa_arctica.AAC.1
MGQVQTLPSPGGPVGFPSFAAATSSNPGGSLPPPLTDVGQLQPFAANPICRPSRSFRSAPR